MIRARVLVAFSILVFLASAGVDATERRVTLSDGSDIVRIARQYLGVPYQYGGNSPGGFDCSGLTSYVLNQAGYQIPRSASNQYGRLNPVRVPKPGDLMFFRTSGNTASHVGIYVGNYQFIHAPSSGKPVGYADIRTNYWKTRYIGSRTVFNY